MKKTEKISFTMRVVNIVLIAALLVVAGCGQGTTESKGDDSGLPPVAPGFKEVASFNGKESDSFTITVDGGFKTVYYFKTKKDEQGAFTVAIEKKLDENNFEDFTSTYRLRSVNERQDELLDLDAPAGQYSITITTDENVVSWNIRIDEAV